MATITNKTLAKYRRFFTRYHNAPDWIKGDVNNATQAVVDLLQTPATRTAVNSAINGATTHNFTASQKALIFAIAALEAAEQEAGIDIGGRL